MNHFYSSHMALAKRGTRSENARQPVLWFRLVDLENKPLERTIILKGKYLIKNILWLYRKQQFSAEITEPRL